MLKQFIKQLVHKIGIHDYQLKMKKGDNRYYECSICGHRIVDINPYNIYSPIDYHWLNHEE
jgi:hypothetical protein